MIPYPLLTGRLIQESNFRMRKNMNDLEEEIEKLEA